MSFSAADIDRRLAALIQIGQVTAVDNATPPPRSATARSPGGRC
jgi:hypothetical protein